MLNSTETAENNTFGYGSLLTAKGNLTYEQFIDLFVRLARKVRPDINIVERYPNDNVSDKVITYTVVSKNPFVEQKPRIRQSIPDPDNPGYVITFWAQRFNYTVRFDCYGKTNTIANDLINWLEEFVFAYTGSFKEQGVAEIIFDNRSADTSTEIAGEHMEVRSDTFIIRVEKIYSIRTKYLEEVSVEMKVNQYNEYDGYFVSGNWVDYFDNIDTSRWDFLKTGGEITSDNSKINIVLPSTGVGKNITGLATKQSFLLNNRINTVETILSLSSLDNAVFYMALGTGDTPKIIGIRIYQNGYESFIDNNIIMQTNNSIVDNTFKKLKIYAKNEYISFSIDSGSGYSFFGELASGVDLPNTAKLFLGVVSNSAGNSVSLSIEQTRVIVKEASQETVQPPSRPVNVVSVNDYNWIRNLI